MAERADSLQPVDLPLGQRTMSLPGLVAEQLSDAIFQGSLPPGERLKEEVLAKRFAVSRTAVREAITILEARGIVERVPRYGARVRVIHPEEIEEIFALRAQLLGLAARITAERADQAAIDEISRYAAEIGKLADEPSTPPHVYANATIEAQRFLMGTLQWKQLPIIYESLSNQALWQMTVRGRSLSFQSADRRKASSEDWKALVTALQARDAGAAENSAKRMLHASYEAVRRLL